MRLTTETHPEGIKRYAHVRPGRGPKSKFCGTSLPGTSRTCTRSQGHGGPHVAHGLLNRVVAVWDSGARKRPARTAATTSRSESQGRRRKTTPVGLPVDRPVSWLASIWRGARGIVSSAEELIFLVYFLAFVGFVVYWTLLILG